MTKEQINEIKRIVEKFIPLGQDISPCHVGICSIKRCGRCQDAVKIRLLINHLELWFHGNME